MSQLRQIDISVIMYADDYKGRLPMPSLPIGELVELSYTNGPLPQYRMLSPYLHNPTVFICPAEARRRGVTNFSDLTRTNLSYFLNADVLLTNNPGASILAGDRNLQANGRAVTPGLFFLSTNLDVNWTRELHGMGGNLAFADGHVEFCRTTNLNEFVRKQITATNRLLVP
jgi:prepilin-type processing-associated H-X9-DG protein